MEVNQLKVDILNRSRDVERMFTIISLLSDKKMGSSFMLDGEWGGGKSFVLDELVRKLQLQQSEETGDDKFFVFNYNCWKYDYYEEPAIAIVAAMSDALHDEIKLYLDKAKRVVHNKVVESIGSIVSKFIENKIGVDLVGIVSETVKGVEVAKREENTFDTMFSFKNTIEYTREQLEELAQERTIVVVVDELDRCMPEYAIKVLERLHHMFYEIDNIIVIMAIDSKQLERSIYNIFGENTSSIRYLKKFNNFTVKLERGEMEDGFDELDGYLNMFVGGWKKEDKEVILDIIKKSQLDIRTIEKIVSKTILLHRLSVDDEKVDSLIMIFEILTEVIREKLRVSEDAYVRESDLEIFYNGIFAASGNHVDAIGSNLADYILPYCKSASSVFRQGELSAVKLNSLERVFNYIMIMYDPNFNREEKFLHVNAKEFIACEKYNQLTKTIN